MRDAHLFIGTRARLQRLSDMKFYSGWVQEISHIEAVLRLKASTVPVLVGDEFSIEVSGKENTAVLIAGAVGVQGAVVRLQVIRGPALLPAKESARLSLIGYPGKMRCEGADVSFTLADHSEKGLGILVCGDVPRDAEAQFEVVTPLGRVFGKGIVRYCRTDTDSPDRKRVGIELTEMDRIGRAKLFQVRRQQAG